MRRGKKAGKIREVTETIVSGRKEETRDEEKSEKQ